MKEVNNTKHTKKARRKRRESESTSVIFVPYFMLFVFEIFVKKRHGINSHAQTH